jgi:hypothetical protein
MRIGYWWGSQRERDNQEDEDGGGWIVLRCILKTFDEVAWTELVWFGMEQVENCSECGNEHSGPMTCRETIEWPNNWGLLE